MASSYTALLGLVLPATGDLNGTWGTTVNTQLTQLVEDSLAGYTTADVTAGDWTLSTTGSGATNQARMMVLVPTGGSVGVPRSIFAPKQSKVYFLLNKTITIVTLKGGPTTPTAGVSINPGQYAFVVWDPIAGDFIIAGIGNNGSWSISTTGTANIAGGTAGAIPYQFAGSQTSVLAAGTSGQLLASGGAGAPTWANPGSLTVSTAANLSGGAGGSVPYQTSAGATAMLANGAAGQVLQSNGGTAAPSWVTQTSALTLGTAQATTSGTAVAYTGLPAGLKRITVELNGVSTNSASNYLIQLGSTTFQTTGYASQASVGSSATGQVTNGLCIATNISGLNTHSGTVVLTHLGSNTWIMSSVIGAESASSVGSIGIGRVTLAGVLDRVQLTTQNGTDTFDAGSFNILYE